MKTRLLRTCCKIYREKFYLNLNGFTIACQLLFGINGRRWEKDYKDLCYRDLFNEHWVFLNESERPNQLQKVEQGCYW